MKWSVDLLKSTIFFVEIDLGAVCRRFFLILKFMESLAVCLFTRGLSVDFAGKENLFLHEKIIFQYLARYFGLVWFDLILVWFWNVIETDNMQWGLLENALLNGCCTGECSKYDVKMEILEEWWLLRVNLWK